MRHTIHLHNTLSDMCLNIPTRTKSKKKQRPKLRYEADVLTTHAPRAILNKLSDSLRYWFLGKEDVKATTAREILDKSKTEKWETGQQSENAKTGVVKM